MPLPNWNEINRCPIWKVLGVTECNNCNTKEMCWGKDELEISNKAMRILLESTRKVSRRSNMKIRARITKIEKRRPLSQKPFHFVEFTLKAYKAISSDPRAKWQVDELLESRNLTGTLEDNITDLMGEEVVLELENKTIENHIFIRVGKILNLSALEEEPEGV